MKVNYIGKKVVDGFDYELWSVEIDGFDITVVREDSYYGPHWLTHSMDKVSLTLKLDAIKAVKKELAASAA